jgi:hypothetical protein
MVLAWAGADGAGHFLQEDGVFHRGGWEDEVLDSEPPDFLRQGYGEVSPDGIGHYDVMVAKLDTMHAHWCTILVSVVLDGPLMHPRCRRSTALLA